MVESQKGKDWHIIRPPHIILNEQQKPRAYRVIKAFRGLKIEQKVFFIGHTLWFFFYSIRKHHSGL